jgi:hypothetical protein
VVLRQSQTVVTSTFFLEDRVITSLTVKCLINVLLYRNLAFIYFLCSVYTIKSRKMIWEWHVARMGEKRNAYRIFVGSVEGKRPLGTPRRRRVDNIKINLR